MDRVNSTKTLEKTHGYAVHFSHNSSEDKRKCKFIDESDFNYHMHRSKVRSIKGTRAVVTLPTVRGRMKSLIVAASSAGIIHHKIISDSTCNGILFTEFISELICILNRDAYFQGAWLIMDNARIHGYKL